MVGLIAAVLATIAFALLARRASCKGRARGLELAGRLSLTAALIALAPAATDATALIYCIPTELSGSSVSVLDGGATAAASIGPKGTGAVSLLASNPFFVCWADGGAHIRFVWAEGASSLKRTRPASPFCLSRDRRAAPVAVITLVVAVGVFPLALYLLVQQDRWLRFKLAESRSVSARVLRCTSCVRAHNDADFEEFALGVDAPPAPSLLAPILVDFKP